MVWEIFKVSIHSSQRMLTLLFYEDLRYIAYPHTPFSNFFHIPPTPTSLSPPAPAPTVFSVVMFLWLNGWSHHIWCAILLNDNMDLYMSSLGTLVQEGLWCVFHATRRQVCSLVEVIYLSIRCYKTRFSLWNTNDTDRNDVNKQNTHPPSTQRKITLERVS